MSLLENMRLFARKKSKPMLTK